MLKNTQNQIHISLKNPKKSKIPNLNILLPYTISKIPKKSKKQNLNIPLPYTMSKYMVQDPKST